MNHKYSFLAAFIILLAIACEQSSVSEERILKQAVTIEDAYSLAAKYSFLTLYSLNPAKDTTKRDQQLYKMKPGEIASIDGGSYKVIKDTGNYTFRASYIYLDGARLTHPQIDSLRALILKKYAAGTSFEDLADKYTMDGNRKHGDVGFFQAGMMAKEFEDGVRVHAKDEVFTLDIPDKKWYYIVKKTADNQGETIRVVLGFNKENIK
jgi:parvulin-like peptidyl-prolyl isomerase